MTDLYRRVRQHFDYTPVKLLVDVLDDLLEAVRVVDRVSEAGRVDHSQPELDSPLFDLHRVGVKLKILFTIHNSTFTTDDVCEQTGEFCDETGDRSRHLTTTDLHRPLDPLLGGRHDTVRVEVGQEEGVDEGGLAQAALPRHHQRELKTLLHRLPVDLVGEVGESHIARRLVGHQAGV